MKENYLIRSATPKDEPTIWQMLMHAAHESSLSVVTSNPALARYVESWGRSGDLGVVAEQQNIPVGAAWVRLWNKHNRGYGYVADEVPELAIATLPNYRAQGIGTQLLTKLLALAELQYSAISLSIRADNPALRLYERIGFVPVAGSDVINREGGRSFSMIYKFTAE